MAVPKGADDRERAADADRRAEVMRKGVIYGQLRDLRARRGVEEVRRAGSLAHTELSGRADNRGGSVDGDGVAESIPRSRVVGGEFRDLLARDSIEEIRRTRSIPRVVVQTGTDDHGGAAHGDAHPEPFARFGVVRGELRDLFALGEIEEVRGAGFSARVVVAHRPDDRDGAADRDGESKPVLRCGIVRGEPSDLETRHGVEEVGRTGVFARGVAPPGADDRGGAADGDGPAEPVARRGVQGGERRGLVAGDGVEQVRGPGAHSEVAVERRADDRRAAAHRYGIAEQITGECVARPNLEILVYDLTGRGHSEERGGPRGEDPPHPIRCSPSADLQRNAPASCCHEESPRGFVGPRTIATAASATARIRS